MAMDNRALINLVHSTNASAKDIRTMINEAEQMGITHCGPYLTITSPQIYTDNNGYLVWSCDDLECATQKELDKLDMLVKPYIPHNEEIPMKEIDFTERHGLVGSTQKYSYYTRESDFEVINEDRMRDRMTDYYYHDENPLVIRHLVKHYFLAGPDGDANPIKRKFYNCVSAYRNYYDGKYGQTTEIGLIKETDISAPIWQDLVVAMVNSGDFTLADALYTVAHTCDRCRHVLLDKYADYLKDPDNKVGYSQADPKFKSNNSRCNYCKYV